MEFKKAERECKCRGCHLDISKGEDCFHDVYRVPIIYCIGCINLIGEMYCDWQMYGEDK